MLPLLAFEDLPTVNNITLDYKGIVIKNKKTKHKVLNHINYLRQLKKDKTSDDNLNLLNSRIRNLSNKHINIKINKNITETKGQLIDQLAMGITLIRDISKHGIINIEDCSKTLNIELFSYLNKKNILSLPANCIVEGINIGFLHATLLNNSSIFIHFDN